ncbi:MAG: hypothetical protein KC591_00765 [Gemmatimonadetes bacterium]|nr:hypothetical protein [Gemmatimonadota bacterium]
MTLQIAGINPAGLESGNSSITAGRDLPWLQETATDDVWGDWAVTYRDVVILNEANERIEAYNLTVHDLAIPTNKETLKAKLREAAGGSLTAE